MFLAKILKILLIFYKDLIRTPKIILAKSPVTQDLYFTIMTECPSAFKGDNRPVETVTWKDAVIFFNKLSELADLTSCYRFNSD